MRHSDWLDRLARTVVTGAPPDGNETVASSDDRYSRASAVKLALAGAASLSLGLWRAAPSAADLSPPALKCINGCTNNYISNDRRLRDACKERFGGALQTPPSSWARIKEFLPLPWWPLAKSKLEDLCYAAADAASRDALRKCNDKCVFDCPKEGSRSLHGSSARSQVCEPTPPAPPKNHTPALPPAPNKTVDPCAPCALVGGECCGPYTLQPDGSFAMCACATRGVEGGCARYGCGG